MKILRKLLIALATFVILIVLTGLFLPRHVKVVRSLTIKASSEVIYAEINNLKSWPKWSPWHRLDPQMQITYSGPESGAGASYNWKGNKNVGDGKMTISSVGTDSIETQMDFMSNGKASAVFRFAKDSGATTVSWTMHSDMGNNPVKKIFGFFFMEKMIGAEFEKGLHNLDSVATADQQNKPAPKVYSIEHTRVEVMTVMTLRRICPSVDSIPMYLGAMFGQIGASMGKQGIKQAGPVFAIYHVFSPAKIDFEAGLPVDKAGKEEGSVKARELPATNALYIDYYGSYNNMKPAYDQLQAYIKTNNLEVTGSPWEVYVGDPGIEKDPNKVLTKIYYPVK